MKTFPLVRWVDGGLGGEKLGLKLNSTQLGLVSWVELGMTTLASSQDAFMQIFFLSHDTKIILTSPDIS